MSSIHPKIVTVDKGVQYIIDSDSSDNVLHVMLQPQTEFSINIRSLCWSSDSIKVKASGLFQRLFNIQKSELVNVRNEGSTPGIIAVSRGYNGNIVSLHLQSGAGLYCNKQYFLGSSSHASITSKAIKFTENNNENNNNQLLAIFNPIAPLIQNSFYFCEASDDGVVFLQSDTGIFKKQLQVNESINISYSCLVAAEQSCSVQTVDVSSSSYLFMMRVRGPGAVYMCTGGKKSMFSVAGMSNTVGMQPDQGHHQSPLLQSLLFVTIVGMMTVLFVSAATMYPHLIKT